jgi:hypothetical protein
MSLIGGEIGIRTLGTLTGTPHFECGAFDHSAISPLIRKREHRADLGLFEVRALSAGHANCQAILVIIF